MPKRKKRSSNKKNSAEHNENNGLSQQGGKIFDRGTFKQFKYCAKCKKMMTWRKKWANNWDTVKYCSKKCKIQSKQKIAE